MANRILIIDDKNQNPMFLTMFLERLGIEKDHILTIQNRGDWNKITDLSDVELLFLDHDLDPLESSWDGEDVVTVLPEKNFTGHVVGISQVPDNQEHYLGEGATYPGFTTASVGALDALNPDFLRQQLTELDMLQREDGEGGIH